MAVDISAGCAADNFWTAAWDFALAGLVVVVWALASLPFRRS
jgi:hypothetical protein